MYYPSGGEQLPAVQQTVVILTSSAGRSGIIYFLSAVNHGKIFGVIQRVGNVFLVFSQIMWI